MRKIKTSIIGFGLSGRYFFAPFIAHHSDFLLHSFVTSQVDLVQQEYSGVEVYQEPETAFENSEIDLVVVASPNHTHYDYAEKALLAGKHVIIEKPLTVSVREADRLIELAQSRRLILAPFQNRRWDGDFLTVQKIIEGNVLGELLYFESHFDRFRPQYERVAWKNENLPGNGILYDLGPHLIDQALALFGMPQKLFADIGIHRLNGEVDDYFDLQLFYGSLKVVLKAGVIIRETGPRFILHGRKGSFVKYGLDPQEMNLRKGMTPENEQLGVDDPEQYGIIHFEKNEAVVRERLQTVNGAYLAFFDNIGKAILNHDPLVIAPEDGRNIIQVIEKAYQSNASGSVVSI